MVRSLVQGAVLAGLLALAGCGDTYSAGRFFGEEDGRNAVGWDLCQKAGAEAPEEQLQKRLAGFNSLVDRGRWAAGYRDGWRDTVVRDTARCGEKARVAATPLGERMDDEQIAALGRGEGAGYARSYCNYLSSEGRPLGAFASVPHDQAEIMSWARKQFAGRAPIYLRAHAPAFAREMAQCRSEEASLRRAGSSLAREQDQAALRERVERLEQEQRERSH